MLRIILIVIYMYLQHLFMFFSDRKKIVVGTIFLMVILFYFYNIGAIIIIIINIIFSLTCIFIYDLTRYYILQWMRMSIEKFNHRFGVLNYIKKYWLFFGGALLYIYFYVRIVMFLFWALAPHYLLACSACLHIFLLTAVIVFIIWEFFIK